MAADRTPNELADALERSQNSYIAMMADGHRSIIVRSKDDELAECYQLMAEAAVLLREQAEQLDTLRAERDALLKAARAVAFCGGCGELPHDPNDECWYYDRSDCEYALRRGICSFDCHEEPSCMTDGPWPMEELRQLLAAAVPQDPGTSATTGRTATRSTPRVTCR